MRLLICEYVTGGGFIGAPLPPGLAQEGDMMLSALVKDLAALGGVDIVVPRDSRLAAMEGDDSYGLHERDASFDTLRMRGNLNGPKNIPHPELVEGRTALIPGSCRVIRVDKNPWTVWRHAIREVDAVWPIAPETGGVLLRLSELVVDAGRTLIGSRSAAVALAASKRATIERLSGIRQQTAHFRMSPPRKRGSRASDGAVVLDSRFRGNDTERVSLIPDTCTGRIDVHVSQSTPLSNREKAIPVVPTVRAVDVARDGVPESSDGWVVKPDDGAGAEATRLFRRDDDLLRWLAAAPDTGNLVVQPYLPGEAASLSMLCQQGRGWLLSCNRQDVVIEDDAFRFRGCIVGGLEQRRPIYARVAAAVAAAIPDLWGYVGIDLADSDSGPVVLEVNPRLTTSYVGLRAAIGVNPAELVLRLLHEDLDAIERPLRIRAQRVDVGALDVA